MHEVHKTSLTKMIHQSSNPLEEVVEYLHQTFPEKYHWVGFYIADPETQTLHLGPFRGEPTEHTRIPFGKGICGIVAKTQKTYVARDVQEESEYLACSPKVKSEIVIPIFYQGQFVAELDIDSHISDAFTQEDIQLLEYTCQMLGENWNQVKNFKNG
jgi:GAF domain-containing protein